MVADLHAFLVAAGATEAEIDRASAEGWLPLLALDRMLMPGAARFDVVGVAAAAGTTVDVAARVRRALGFPDVPEGINAFTDRDADALRLVVRRLDAAVQLGDLEHQVRVVSASLARLASFEADLTAEWLELARVGGADDEMAAAEILEEVDWATLSALIEYTHRVLYRAALWRRLARPTGAPTVDAAVGFADLVGYTELAEELDERELSNLLARFEAIAFDTVAEYNGRIVKTIGDEVMFVGAPADIARVALALVERVAADPLLPDVRIGVASGSLLARDGDFYGPVVNLASRLTDRAHHATVLASDALHDALADDADIAWRRLAGKRIRGIGDVDLYVMRPAR